MTGMRIKSHKGFNLAPATNPGQQNAHPWWTNRRGPVPWAQATTPKPVPGLVPVPAALSAAPTRKAAATGRPTTEATAKTGARRRAAGTAKAGARGTTRKSGTSKATRRSPGK